MDVGDVLERILRYSHFLRYAVFIRHHESKVADDVVCRNRTVDRDASGDSFVRNSVHLAGDVRSDICLIIELVVEIYVRNGLSVHYYGLEGHGNRRR